MNVFGAKIVFLVVVVFWILPDFTASNVDMCSCYSFHGNSSSRQEARQHCKHAKGDLVSIEAKEELNFIQKQLQNETTKNGDNEWWIGLEKENGKWKWLSNHTDLPIDESLLQSESEGQAFVTIAHNASYASLVHFNVIFNDTVGKGWICEYKIEDCNVRGGNVCKQVLVMTTITTTTTNTYSTTNEPATTTRITSTTASTTKPITPTTTPPPTTTTPTTTPPPPTPPPTTTPPTTTTPTTTTTPPTTTTPSTAAAAAATTKIKTTMTTSTTKSKITATPKTAKFTSAAPTTATTTSAMTRRRPPFIGFLTTTASQVHECLPDLYLILAISVSVVGLATVVFFINLFLFVVCRKKCLKPQQSVEKIEMAVGEYENHL